MAKLCLAFRGRPIRAYYLEAGTEAVIGSDPECNIMIDSLAVAPRHAKIITTAHSTRIISLNDAFPTLVNHHPVTGSPLSHGDLIQVGKHTLAFSEEGQAVGLMRHPAAGPGQERDTRAAPSQNTGRARDTGPREKTPSLEEAPHVGSCVQIVSGKHFGRVVPLDRGLVRLGYAGRASALIAHRKDGYYLSHLEGKAPPRVNGESIGEQSHPLRDGDKIRIGNVRMIFHLRSAAAAPPGTTAMKA